MTTVASLKVALVVFGVTVGLAVLADRITPHLCGHLVPNIRILVRRTVVIAIMAAGLLCALWLAGVTVVPAVALGAIAASLSLGLQGILSNVFAGFYVLAERPFEVGDVIMVENTTGTVTDVGLRVTRLQLNNGQSASVPNSIVMNSTVIEIKPGNSYAK